MFTNFCKSISSKVKTLREERNIPINDLSSFLNISTEDYINKEETNNNNYFEIEELHMLSKIFYVPIEVLLRD